MIIKPISSGSARGNCIFVSDGETPLIIDAGLRAQIINQAIDHKLHEVKGVLISHEHGDHSKGAAELAVRGIDVYASAGTIDALPALKGLPTVHALPRDLGIMIGTWFVFPFPIKHDAAEPLGFYCVSANTECFAYITDTPYTKYVLPPCTHIMIEANYDIDKLRAAGETGALPAKAVSRIRWSHLSIQSAIKFLKANDLSRCVGIWLLHLSDDRSDAEDFKRRVMAATGKPTWIA